MKKIILIGLLLVFVSCDDYYPQDYEYASPAYSTWGVTHPGVTFHTWYTGTWSDNSYRTAYYHTNHITVQSNNYSYDNRFRSTTPSRSFNTTTPPKKTYSGGLSGSTYKPSTSSTFKPSTSSSYRPSSGLGSGFKSIRSYRK